MGIRGCDGEFFKPSDRSQLGGFLRDSKWIYYGRRSAPGVFPTSLWAENGTEYHIQTLVCRHRHHNPTAKLSIHSRASQAELDVRYYGSGSYVRFGRANGVIEAPTPISLGNRLSTLQFDGFTGAAFGSGAEILAEATQDWEAGGRGTNLQFRTTSNFNSTPMTRMTIGENGNIGIGSYTTNEARLRVDYTPTNLSDITPVLRLHSTTQTPRISFTTGANTSNWRIDPV